MLTVTVLLSGKVQIAKYYLVQEVDFIVDIQAETNTYSTIIFENDFQISMEVVHAYTYAKEENFLKPYKYYQLIEITLEDMMRKERFLADFHVINFLWNETTVDKVDICRLLVGLSNLLRLASAHSVDEIHALSLRIFRKFSDQLKKDIFFITEY